MRAMLLLLLVSLNSRLSVAASNAELQPSVEEQRTVVAVPFAATTGERWIGTALAHALNLRIYAQPGLNALDLRQVRSAARNDGLDLARVADAPIASQLGRQLGADVMVIGDYTLARKALTLNVQVIRPGVTGVLFEGSLEGTLEKLVDLEARLACEIARALGAESPDVTEGAFGTRSVSAWREATLGLIGLSRQSLSPKNGLAQSPGVLPEKRLEALEAHFQAAVSADEDYGEAWAGLGLVALLRGNDRKALVHLQRATAVSGSHQPTAVLASYYLRLRQGKRSAAAEILENAVARHPGFLHARGYLAELYTQNGEYPKAARVYSDYLAVAPRQPWALAQRGYVSSKLGDFAGAIADTLAAVDLLPRSPTLLIELASRYIDAGKLIGAEDSLKHALELHPQEGRIYVRLCYVYLLQRNDEVAISMCEKGLALSGSLRDPRDRAYAHLNLAQSYGRLGQLDTAFQHLEQAEANGMRRFQSLEQDPELQAMRRDRRFRAMVQNAPRE